MRFAGATAALALALLAQHRLTGGAPPLEVGALFLAAVGLAIRYFPSWKTESCLALRCPNPPAPVRRFPAKEEDSPPHSGEGLEEESRPTAGEESGQRTRHWLLATAGLAGVGALILAAGGRGWPWDGLLWALSLVAFLAALADRDWFKSLQPFTRGEGLALVAVLALALLARVYHLGHLPQTIHGDEAQFGLNARAILRGEQPTLFAVGWYQFPIASFAAQAGVMRLFGDDITGLRLSSALFGTLTLLPVYLLTRSTFDRRVALASAMLMAIGHWPIHFSRLGINNIQATFFAAWAVYLAWRALQTGHRLDYALTGLALGLGLYTYYAARLMPLVVGGMLLGRGLSLRQWRASGLYPKGTLLTLVIAGTLAIGPQAVYFMGHPEPLISRQRGVFLFNNLPHLESAYHTDDWAEILRQQAVKSLLVFNAQGDSSGQYGFDEPMLDKLTASLMVVGFGLSLWRWRRGGHWVLHLWFWPNLLLGSALTIDAPFVPRLSALMPVPFIWAGVALGGWWRQAAEGLAPHKNISSLAQQSLRRALLTSVPVVALLILVGWTNYDAYINRYIRRRSFMLDSTEAAHLIAALPASTQVYLMGAHNIYAGFSTFRFVVPNAVVWDVVNVADWVPVRQPDPLDTLFLIWPPHLDRLPYLQRVYPDGDYQPHLDQKGHPMFATYRVSAQAIRQRQRLATLPSQADETVNEAWQGTLWLPDDGPRQFCLSAPGYLQIEDTRIEGRSCDGLTPALDLPAGPHPVKAGATAGGEVKEVELYWRRDGGVWEEVPHHLLWDEMWSGGLLGVFEREGTLLRREIAPLIAYRDFSRELTSPVQATWTGCLTADTPGDYEFRIRSFDGARLTADDRTLIEDSHRGTLGEAITRVELRAGGHPVRLEALFTNGPRWLEWYWRPPGSGGDWALVPPEVLTPDAGCPAEE